MASSSYTGYTNDAGLPYNSFSSGVGLPPNQPERVLKSAQTATFTVYPADAGSVILLGAPGAVATATLPPASMCSGQTFRFLCTGRPTSSTNVWTILSPSANLYGSIVSATTGSSAPVLGRQAIGNTGLNWSSFANTGAQCEIFSDGTNYMVSGYESTYGATGSWLAFT